MLISHEGIAYHRLFVIDGKGIVRHQVVNDLPLGHSVEETLHILDALIYLNRRAKYAQLTEKKGKQA